MGAKVNSLLKNHGWKMLVYFSNLSVGKTILWCYLIWYITVVINYFDPAPLIWINSIGISVVIGFALLLSVGRGGSWSDDKWQTFRLFLMPFCVSSFSSLIKNQGFFLIIPPRADQLFVALGLCFIFVSSVLLLKRNRQRA